MAKECANSGECRELFIEISGNSAEKHGNRGWSTFKDLLINILARNWSEWKLPYIFFMNRLSKLLPSRSFVKQILGAGALASTSSCLSQTFIEKNDEIDYQRVLNFGLVTMAIVGPIQFHWFRFLSRFIEGTSFKTGFKRMVVDQLIAAPLLTSLFLFNIQLLESKSIDTSINRTRNVLGAVMTNNYKLWPMVQLINMSVMGAKNQNQRDLKVQAVNEIVAKLIEAQNAGQSVNLNKLKCDVSSRLGMDHQPKLVEIIAAVPEDYKDLLLPKLKAKPVRTASGIAVVAVMCKPHRCPHINFTGNICVYCPGGPDSDFEYSTQSYTGYEPTSMRAIRARYNPYIQTVNRLAQLKQLGHNIDKVEFIIMGGTFMSLPKDYRDNFISNLHDALSGHISSSVAEAVKFSEVSDTKCIGITIETRPDYCLPRHMDDMLAYGCTRLEIGVQSVYEDVARDTNRGHTVKAVCETFHMAKDTGYKVVIHMMPNLPNVPIERDLAQFVDLFEDPDFRPDGLKLYPTLVIRSTGLYELWRTGRYKSYPPQVLVDLVAQILALVPPWTRVYRVQRDIPMPLVSSGVEYGNLREHALARMEQLGLKCRDVRTREVGITEIHQKIRPDQVELVRRDYYANNGWETFLTYEDAEQDILIGLLRLRKCTDKVHREELKGATSVVRELHVYGTSVPVASRDPTKFQHQGYGSLLMEEAERIAREEHLSTKIAVISGVGTRHYYRKLGYELDGPYMSKHLV
ncbi:unnamed protein product [Bursaphelenchus xylophilus]|uniref:Elongator complex protein 3 n=2 Tax=Bursaphelenchus xylophilus TaxID=6326 RepID=A0A7I8XDV9_BURXY|nr:unnamed protein product [Bursaphelenchus xylophilus]CAG9131799.1 unnamed protein product [Bursaphelenchus xylophilus]